MNVAMYENRLTQENVAALLTESRYRAVGPEVGLLADGETGAGRLAPVGAIVQAARDSMVEHVVVGEMVSTTGWSRLRPTVVDRIIDDFVPLNVHIFSKEPGGGEVGMHQHADAAIRTAGRL